jgi:hypothetical protein
MSRKIGSKFCCEFCNKLVTLTGGRQRTCKGRECRLKLRSENRKVKRREDRKRNPKTCVYCCQPITELGKRKYHPECRALKNADRVRDYHLANKDKPSIGPKKRRKYKGYVRCRYCKITVRRTGARQLTCTKQPCRNARKAELKRNARTFDQRLQEAFEKKERQRQRTVVGIPDTYRVAVALDL